MLLHVNPASGVPTYLQIETQVKHYVAAGALAPGDALPSVRKLAADMRISPNTVVRAYLDLEKDGVLRTVPGGRTYVAENSPSLLKSESFGGSGLTRGRSPWRERNCSSIPMKLSNWCSRN